MNNLLKTLIAPLTLVISLGAVAQAQTKTEEPGRKSSIAAEADILSYFVSGYSGIVNVSLANGFQVAFGAGRYDVPTFLLEGDENYEKAKWEATATSIQVLRMTYRFKGPRKNGPALGAIVLNQNWTLSSEPLGGETKFKQINAGITGGYYLHLGKHLYLYPTAAFTYNNVYSGSTSVNGTSYTVAKFAPNGSLHMGWEF
jgi:hypothetical protein